jgi:hypothetical protein
LYSQLDPFVPFEVARPSLHKARRAAPLGKAAEAVAQEERRGPAPRGEWRGLLERAISLCSWEFLGAASRRSFLARPRGLVSWRGLAAQAAPRAMQPREVLAYRQT